MSLVTPIPQASTIRLYSNIGWDSSNKDIRLFATATERDSYLSTRLLTNGEFNNCSIVKTGKSIKLEGRINDLIKATYLSFTNRLIDQTERTFYAFVTSVNYINVNTCEIQYEIDWIQSYLFDFVFEASMVEREHVNNDAVGANTLDEGMEIGEYTILNTVTKLFSPIVMVQLLATEITSKVSGGVVTAVDTLGYLLTQLGLMDDLLAPLVDAPERVVSMQMGVTKFCPDGGGSFVTGFTDTVTVGRPSAFKFRGNTYTPKNNKMYTYPFMLLTADNYMGQVEQFQWELGGFESTSGMDFKIWGTPTPKPILSLAPLDYYGNTGQGTGESETSQKAIIYDNFPQCPWLTDSYKAWMSQYGSAKTVSAGANVATNLVAGGLAAASGNYMGAATLGISAVTQAMGAAVEVRNHQIHSMQLEGTIGSAGLQYMKDQVGFRLTCYGIRPEYAKRIDDFFTRYGYRVDAVKVPNTIGRQSVNYVKTNGGKVIGNIPNDAKLIMERAMDNGVSFWHVDSIGEPLANNPIV